MDERKTPRDGAGRIGEILLRAALISREELREALDIQRAQGGRLGHILVDRGFVDQLDFAEALARQLGIPLLRLAGYELDPRVAGLLPRGSLEHHRVLPLQVARRRVTLAMADPFNEVAVHELRRASGFEVKPVLATTSDILATVAEVSRRTDRQADLFASLRALRERDRGAIPAGYSEAV